MTYTSVLFLFVLLPISVLLYQLVPQRHRWKVLLLISYLFFYSISGKLLGYLLLSTISMYYFGLWLGKCKTDYNEQRRTSENKKALKVSYGKKKFRILWLGMIMQIAILVVLKYSQFFCGNINEVLKAFSSPVLIPKIKFIVPIGISFYTLQVLSYLLDIYYQKIEPDRNLGRLALYLSFFPTILEGPICRYSQTAVVLHQGNSVTYKNFTYGSQRILWGLFKNFIIADRLNMLVERVFDKPIAHYGGVVIIVASVLYTFQLYANFSGSIDITIGVGEIFGVTIPENFRQPFFSKTASEFWRRWHITLGTWLKDYIFYPISLTKFVKNLGKDSKAKFGKHMGQIIPSSIALFGVWTCNGLWHGTGWQYIFYGMYYFVLILLGNTFEPWIHNLMDTLKIKRESIPYRTVQTIKMLVIIFIGELFFRAKSLSSGLKMFGSIFTEFRWSTFTDGSLLRLGLTNHDYVAVLFGLIAMLIVSILHEKGISIRDKIAGWNIYYRWGFFYATIMIIIILGAYGDVYIPPKLIYAGF